MTSSSTIRTFVYLCAYYARFLSLFTIVTASVPWGNPDHIPSKRARFEDTSTIEDRTVEGNTFQLYSIPVRIASLCIDNQSLVCEGHKHGDYLTMIGYFVRHRR